MIAQWIVDFVHGPVVSWIGSRDSRLRPSVSWTFGARVDARNDLITTFVPDIEADQVKRDLSDNGTVAFNVANGISHECYQFKGKILEMRSTTAEERAIQEIHQTKLRTYYTKYPEQLFPGFVIQPSTAVVFRVEEAFSQTPGPGAGDRLDLAAPRS